MTWRRIQLGTTVALIGAASVLALPTTHATPIRDRAIALRFQLLDLGTLGGDESMALGLNDSGAVVGWSETAGSQMHAFIWENGVMTNLGTLGGEWSRAAGVNNLGEVIGTSETETGEVHAFIWSDHWMRDLNTIVRWMPAGDTAAFVPETPVLNDVRSINENGWIVGTATVPDDDSLHGFVLIPGMDMTYKAIDLGVLPGTEGVLPYCINDENVVVGVSGTLAFQWERGTMVPLDLFTRTVIFESHATGISNHGLTVGWFAEGRPVPHTGCMWQGGVHYPLGAGGGSYYEATGVNSRNQIVGWNLVEEGFSAVLWQGREMTDLNDVTAVPIRAPGGLPLFPWERLVSATAVDENGWITGFGESSDGRVRGFLLKPLQMVGY